MDLTPREIQEKQFHDVFRGYNHEEVDVFLDEVAEAFERIYRENQNFHHRLRDLEEQLKTARATEDMLKRTLITAQKTAEEAVDEAKSRALGLIDEAEKRSVEIVASAESRAKQIIDEAKAKQGDLETKLEGLRRFEQEYRTRLNAFIESQLQVLAEGPVPPAKPMTPAESPAGQKPVPKPVVKGPAAEPPATKAEVPAAPFAGRPAATKAPSPPTKTPAEPPKGNGGDGRPKPQQGNGGVGARPRTSVETRPPMTSPVQKPAPIPAKRDASPEAPPEEELDEESIRKLFWGEE